MGPVQLTPEPCKQVIVLMLHTEVLDGTVERMGPTPVWICEISREVKQFFHNGDGIGFHLMHSNSPLALEFGCSEQLAM